MKMIAALFNEKIAKHANKIYDAQGEEAALAYCQQFVKTPIREALNKFSQETK